MIENDFHRVALCSVAIVVAQHPSQRFTTSDVAIASADFIAWLDDLVGQSLVIALLVKMRQVTLDGIAQRVLAEEDHAVKAFLLEPFPSSAQPFPSSAR